jgi:alpha-D-xyloside xylohydrolase
MAGDFSYYRFFALADKHSPPYEKQKDGVLFEIKKQKVTDPQWIKIQVCTESIIRVIASPEKSFSSRPSLMLNKTDWDSIAWSLNEKDDYVEISTAKLIVRVEPKTICYVL